jgi:hypothetical protein
MCLHGRGGSRAEQVMTIRQARKAESPALAQIENSMKHN